MIPHPIVVSPAWDAAGWTMLHLFWIGAAFGLVVALLRRLLHPARPEIRHGVAVACLLAFSAAPFVLFATIYRPTPAPESAAGRAGLVAPTTGPVMGPIASPSVPGSRRPFVGRAATAPVPSRFEAVVGYLPGVWLSGSMITMALIAAGLVGVEQLRRSSRPLALGEILERCGFLAARLGISRRVGLAICDRIAMPVLIGVVRPMILLPPAAISGWDIDQVEMALLHELAHIRRHDNLVTILQRLAEAMLFFHPLTWWLSGWVSLERELCCDRLVVEHTGRPQDYARMLAALAGAGPGAHSLAMAMAERPLTTRIRRILDMEDRSMKWTLKEGLGLLAVAIVGTIWALAAHARPPEPVPADAARRDLERLTERVIALPDGSEGGQDAGQPYGDRSFALIGIAQAHLKLGDRASALATIRRLEGLAEPSPPRPGANAHIRGWTRFAALIESADLRREMGDLDGGRATLDRAARQFDTLDHGELRGAIDRVGQEIDAALARKVEGTWRLNDEDAAFISEAAAMLVQESIELGDRARARALARRLFGSIEPTSGTMKAMLLTSLGSFLVKAGDLDGGRPAIEQARQAALALPDPNARAFVLEGVAKTLVEAGDLEAALDLLEKMTSRPRRLTLVNILESLSTIVPGGPSFDPAGISIKIGDARLRPKDPGAARRALPKIADAARASGDVKVQARTLASVAHLQARSGDIPGALATARSIPALKRSDFPGPSDGFYDAVKPVAFALIAGVQRETGDRSGAAATLGEAEALARTIGAEDQKLIAQIAIAQTDVACDRRDAAKALLAAAIPLALAQPEPRRSRVLTMFAEVQVQVGDTAGASMTIDAIREYPGLEKARALRLLARWFEEAGDAATAETVRRRAVALLESKAPEKPLPGPVMTGNAFAYNTFIDFDLELKPMLNTFRREMLLDQFRIELGDVEAAIRGARALPAPGRHAALSEIAGHLARQGDVRRAMDLAASIESSESRMSAFTSIARAIPERPARK